MFGRRVGSSVLRIQLHARLPFRPSPFHCQSSSVNVLSVRCYASPGRPRRTVGEPSRPVKRAVKRAAKTTEGGPAAKQVKAKKATAAKKQKTAKPKPVGRPTAKRSRKELTEEQQAAQKVKLAKAKTTDLKKAALKPPSNARLHAYNAFCSEKLKGANAEQTEAGVEKAEKFGKMSSTIASLQDEWKSLSSAELEHYNHLAHTATEANQAEYKRWVESHTPEQIHLANRARTTLRRQLGDAVKNKRTWAPIKDERHVKRPASSFVQFNVNRQASGDFKNIKLGERLKLIAQEWKALSESEKSKYKTLQRQDQRRYGDEHSSVYGHSPPSYDGVLPAQQAAAAA